MSESQNPYEAPQAPLQQLPVALPIAKRRSFLMQGFIFGLQFGGLVSLGISLYSFFSKESITLGLPTTIANNMIFFTLVGTLSGGIIQLLAFIFRGTSSEVAEQTARQEFDNTGFTPPNML